MTMNKENNEFENEEDSDEESEWKTSVAFERWIVIDGISSSN